jgi:hypothetical protein
LVSRAAQLHAFESVGREVARAAQTFPTWAEDLNAAAHSGGVAAVSAWLRAKSIEFCDGLAEQTEKPLADSTGEAFPQ